MDGLPERRARHLQRKSLTRPEVQCHLEPGNDGSNPLVATAVAVLHSPGGGPAASPAPEIDRPSGSRGFGLGGVGFALGNLLLARALPPAEFGVFTLFLALVQMGASLAPIGLQGQVNRHPMRAVSPGRPLLTSAIVGGAPAASRLGAIRVEAALLSPCS